MSRVLAAQFARELREQRFVLLGAAALLALGAACGAVFVARGELPREALRVGLAFAGASLFLLTIAGDLLSGDALRGTREFLARSPRGLRAAFAGKLLLLLVTAPVLPVLGLLLGTLAPSPRAAEAGWTLPASIDSYVTLPLLGLALWTFAAAAFVKRAVLALPLALVVLSPVIAITLAMLPGSGRAWQSIPFWCTWLETPELGLAWLCGLALLAARSAYLWGPRRGAGLVVLGMPLLLVPGLVELYRANTPSAHELRFHGGRLEGQSLRCFAQDARGHRHWFVAVDLESGNVRRLHEGTDGAALFAERDALLPLPDGSRAWLGTSGARVEREGRELAAYAFEAHCGVAAGLGIQVATSRKAVFADEPRRTIDLLRRIAPDTPQYRAGGCIVLEDAWLVGDRPPRFTGGFAQWRLRDPQTGIERPAPGMQDGDRVVLRLRDGRLVVQSQRDRRRSWSSESALVDLSDASRRALRVGGEEHRPLRLGAATHPVSEALGRDWLLAGQDLVSIAPGEGTLRLDARNGRVITPLDERHLLISADDGRELLRLDAASGEATRIHPR